MSEHTQTTPTPSEEKPRFLEDSMDFMRALNAAANIRDHQFQLMGRYLAERPALHATLAELLRQYPPTQASESFSQASSCPTF